MKHKILLALAGLIAVATSCSDFLDETPDKSGSAYIYHMDQLYGLTGSPDLYLFAESEYMMWAIVSNFTYEQTLMSDAVECSPEFYVRGLNGGSNNILYDIYSFRCRQFIDESSTLGITWTPVWNRIYRFNTVLENLDKVEQSTEAIRNEVEGEARFGRAYYHFLLLTQYCLWGDDAPGLGYRDNAKAGEVPQRQTDGDYCVTAETQRWLKPTMCHTFSRFNCNGRTDFLGMTTAEMYLIKAECLARAGRTTEAAETLRTLRRTRFLTAEAADNIGGTISEVLDERYREMGALWRFFDMKRLNGAEHANLHVRRDILTDPSDLSSVTTLDIGPDDPRWALPLNQQEAESMGWEQNDSWQ